MKLQNSSLLVAILAMASLLPAPLSAFNVVKNVNSSQAPVDQVVLFEKGKEIPGVEIMDGPGAKFTLNAEGQLEAPIKGSDAVKLGVTWKPGVNPSIPSPLDATKYAYVMITCKMEGLVRNTLPGGKIQEVRADNLWFSAAFFDAKGERAGAANLADATENSKTPVEMMTLRMPMVLFTFWANSLTDVQGIGFYWDKARSTSDRDFRLVVEKISLAN